MGEDIGAGHALDELVEMKTSKARHKESPAGINRRPPPVQHGGVLRHTTVGTPRWWRRGCTQGG